ncbi:LppX_LprAFG lipoprotein [Yimella sp. cx-51]|uniref:LppX_LprAFG lipoprotein n=1 Tax=Yimella sp. cx-51 TaxID=2770551 RepID=UPI00165DA0CD|nr:LppX_LprAFG lipoprotein [Yimella sp. cx-51]MBC9955698.1 LppX_LprAFG lipoprotein [Yimella sp. cx-51]QTH37733.1 LppX_LprAFG lipoprotein [Yimella sp. cx-51]
MRLRSTSSSAAVVGLTLALAVTGCSSTSGKKSSPTGSGGASPTAQQRLADAKKVLDGAAGYHFKLQGTDVPKQSSGVLSGEGDVIAKPAFKGTLNVQAGSLAASVPVVSIDGKTYAKMPFASKMTTINPNSYGAPDPNLLFSKDKGLGTLLPQTQNPTFGGKLREGKDVVQSVTGKLPGSAIKAVLYMGDGTGTFDVTYNVTEDNQLRSAQMVGPFFAGGTKSTYNVTLTDFGKTVDIQAP